MEPKNKKKGTNELLFIKQKHSHRYRKQTYGYQGGEEAGMDKFGDWD